MSSAVSTNCCTYINFIEPFLSIRRCCRCICISVSADLYAYRNHHDLHAAVRVCILVIIDTRQWVRLNCHNQFNCGIHASFCVHKFHVFILGRLYLYLFIYIYIYIHIYIYINIFDMPFCVYLFTYPNGIIYLSCFFHLSLICCHCRYGMNGTRYSLFLYV